MLKFHFHETPTAHVLNTNDTGLMNRSQPSKASLRGEGKEVVKVSKALDMEGGQMLSSYGTAGGLSVSSPLLL